MDEDRITGAAQKITGSTKEAAGNVLGDTKLQVEGKADRLEGAARNALGNTEDTVRDLGESVEDEIARLRGQIERLMQERVTPALAGAAEAAENYARQAKDVVTEQSERLSVVVKDRPLLAVGVVAAVGYVIGRLAGSNTYVYPRR